MKSPVGDRRSESVWVLPDDTAPLRHVRAAYEQRHGPVDAFYWETPPEGCVAYGRSLALPLRGRGYPMSVKLISPRLAVALARHRAEVVVVLELDLVAVYAVLSRAWRRRRRVVALIEGDVAMLGPTGSARWKMAFRRAVARHVDGFAANNDHATRYLTGTLGVPAAKVHQAWWLAGFPDDLVGIAPPVAVLAARQGPTFAAVGQLIARKGHAELLRAAARFTRDHGPCQVWVLGEGPDRAALERLAADLGMGDAVTFFGMVDPAHLKGALEAADLFVFPTHNDLVGRALIEALSVGTPVVVSHNSGAIGTLLHDGRDCVVVDPDDPEDLARGLAIAADPDRLADLRRATQEVRAKVTVAAAADAIAHAAGLINR